MDKNNLSSPYALQYGIVHRPKKGRDISGDAYLIAEDEKGVLIGVIDGLGSGEAAAQASQVAAKCVKKNSSLSLADITTRCHHALKGTRGVVMMLMRIDFIEDVVAFLGVGNVNAHVQSADPIKPIPRNGIVGYRLPRLQEFRYHYTPGDLFVLHTDGISSRFVLSAWSEQNPLCVEDSQGLQALAEEIAQLFGKDDDDITIVVAR